MRVLLLNPEDRPFDGPWARESWDLVVDFGWAGGCSYAEWAKVFGCPTYGLFNFGEEIKDLQRIGETLRAGRGQLVDEDGIDWWELMAPARYSELHDQLLLLNLNKQIPSNAEVRASRPYRLVSALEALRISRIDSYLPESRHGISEYAKRLRGLRLRQLLGVVLDKWDADFGFRRFTAPRAKNSRNGPRVLLPSSYVNVSRILCAYASTLPERQFLLATTRASGRLGSYPRNVAMASLASYAPLPRLSATEKEISDLQNRWQRFRNELLRRENWRLVIQRGCYGEFSRWLRNGMRMRDAWRRVLERESIEAVLCGDENNWVTRLPVLLARNKKIATVSCSHGALDMTLILRGVAADMYLARGEMERDYLFRTCSVAPERVTVGGPRPFSTPEQVPQHERDQIVLFSEPYELYSGRVDVFYSEVLPWLAAIARSQQKRAVVKLHPFENLSQRTSLVDRTLPSESRALVELTNEPLTDAFLDRTWFALTVESSVAVDCALRAVPCFLCGWYELGLYGYGRQYEKYGAARMLRTPQEILEIPDILWAAATCRVAPQGLVWAIEPGRLDELFRGKRDPQLASAGRQRDLGKDW